MKDLYRLRLVIVLLLSLLMGLCVLLIDRMAKINIEKKTTQLLGYPDKFQNAGARAEYMALIRGSRPEAKKIIRARKFVERMYKEKTELSRDAGINAWDDLGPDNIGGRVRAIAIDPNNASEIYVGAVAGGIWRSTNSGSNWNQLVPDPLAFPITSIAIDPTNTNTIYSTTGEFNGSGAAPGIGILKSEDGGSSWVVQSGPPAANFFWLSKIIINPLDTDVLYAVGSDGDIDAMGPNGRVYRSTDAGTTWNIIFTDNINPASVHIYDIEMNPGDTAEIVIGTQRQALISTDSGQNWSSLMGASPLITTNTNDSGQRCEVAYCPNNSNTIYILRYLRQGSNPVIDFSELWQTTDGGANWSNLVSTSGTDEDTNILTRQGNYDNAIWVDPTNCNRVLLGGINIWKWTGTTLTRISNWSDDIDGNANGGNNSAHADQHIFIEDPNYDGNNNNRVYVGNDGGIYKSDNIWSATTNSGWAELVDGLRITQLYGVDVSRTGDTLVGGSQDNSYFVDRTGNSSDLGWGVFSTGDGAHSAIKKSNPEIMYTSIQRGRIFKSSDGGDTFCRVATLDNTSGSLQCGNFTSLNDNPLFIAPLEMDPNQETRVYIAGERLWRTQNEGTSWQLAKTDAITNRQISTIEIAVGDEQIIWVGYDNGTVSMTTDGGTNWNNVHNNGIGLSAAFVTDIAINPNNHNEVIITQGGGYNQANVFYSDDAGLTWENRSLPFDMLTRSVIWHPQVGNWIYLGTDQGVFASEDDGQTWNITPIYSQNDGPVFASVTELVWQGDGSNAHPYYLVAATHSRGVWRSKFPIRNKYYVDKNCNPCGLGSFSEPYATFREAVTAAGNGSEVVFLSSGTHDEVPADILVDKRIKVTLHSSVSTSVIIE